jgi:hypothetical protein
LFLILIGRREKFGFRTLRNQEAIHGLWYFYLNGSCLSLRKPTPLLEVRFWLIISQAKADNKWIKHGSGVVFVASRWHPFWGCSKNNLELQAEVAVSKVEIP